MSLILQSQPILVRSILHAPLITSERIHSRISILTQHPSSLPSWLALLAFAQDSDLRRWFRTATALLGELAFGLADSIRALHVAATTPDGGREVGTHDEGSLKV